MTALKNLSETNTENSIMKKCKCESKNIFKREIDILTYIKGPDTKKAQKYIEYMCMDCTYTIRVKVDN